MNFLLVVKWGSLREDESQIYRILLGRIHRFPTLIDRLKRGVGYPKIIPG